MTSMDRFTKRAKQVLYYAQEEARYFNHPFVGTEHLLLGLIREQDHIAGKVLDELGVKHAQARSAVEFMVGHGAGLHRNADLELTGSAKMLLEYAWEESRTLNHHHVGTEHLLLGLVRKGGGVATAVLELMGIDLEQVRTYVLGKLALGPSSGLEPITPPDRNPRSMDRSAIPEANQRTLRSWRPPEAERPRWAGPPLFAHEARLQGDLYAVQARATELQRLLQAYHAANALPWLTGDALAAAVPTFFAAQLGMAIERDHYDHAAFWITDAQAEKLVLVATTTYAGAVTKGGIYALYSRREAAQRDPEFPALLVVNAHTTASSWDEKLRPIERQDYELAAQDQMLMVRIEDLLYLWHALIEGRLEQAQLITLFRNEQGWLEVQEDGTFRVHR